MPRLPSEPSLLIQANVHVQPSPDHQTCWPDNRENFAVCAVPAPLEASAFNPVGQITIAEFFQSRLDAEFALRVRIKRLES